MPRFPLPKSRRKRRTTRQGPDGVLIEASTPAPGLEPTGAPIHQNQGGESLFSSLDAALPLVLLPIRIEARWYLENDPPELRLRFFPDTLHADGHDPTLTTMEQDLGRAFWERTWRTGGDVVGKDEAFGWLAGQLGPWRAAWVARSLRPVNEASAPTTPIAEDQALDPAPIFPAVEGRTTPLPTYARLLPSRFAVMGYRNADLLGTWWGSPIPDDLPFAPGPVDAADVDGRSLLDAQDLRWTWDFDEAERKGMALRIDVSDLGDEVRTDGFHELIVVGVRGEDEEDALTALLTAQRYTEGLDFLPQGTPTNQTETAAVGLSLASPDLAALRVAELESEEVEDRPKVSSDGALYRMSAANAATRALGLGDSVLDRAQNANLPELAWSEAMNQALWPATWGHYVDSLLQGALVAEDRGWLRDWFVHFVRGGGPLPTLLVGADPYGLLPVTLVEAPGRVVSNLDQLQDVILTLRGYWDDSVSAVPHLDPDASDAVPVGSSEEELAAVVSQVLASVPHPTQFRLRTIEGKRSEYTTQYEARMWFLGMACGLMPNEQGEYYADLDDNPAWALYQALEADLDAATEVDAQLAAFEVFADACDREGRIAGIPDVQEAFWTTWEAYTRDNLMSLVEAHRDRSEPADFLERKVDTITRKMGDADDPSTFFAWAAAEGEEQTWNAVLVAPDHTAASAEQVRSWLDKITASVTDDDVEVHDYTLTFPLLRQLLRWSTDHLADPDDTTAFLAGMATLDSVFGATPEDAGDPASVATPAAADPVGELERLMRETLGVASSRLDAWYTSVGAWRLEHKRHNTRRGVQVGAYGWLLDVAPRTTEAPSQGYVFAPSLAHASTAAILRAGWSAWGGDAETAGLAVNLSSDRIRRARWLVEGVRRGDELGELIGARFEERLQGGLDTYIADVRALARDATGARGPADSIVDGLLIARAWSDAEDLTEEETSTRTALEALVAGAGGDAAGLTAVLDDLAGDLDAVADASVAQAVYSLAEGNVAEAGATLTASATGEVAFPPIRFANTPREALTITHRLVALLDPSPVAAWPGAATSGRAIAAPGLEQAAERLLRDPRGTTFSVRFTDAAGVTVAGPFHATLADVGVAALDLILLSPLGEEVGLGRFDGLLRAWAETLRPADGSAATLVLDTAVGDPSLDDVVLASRALRALLVHARSLDGRDLVEPGATEVTSGVDVDELTARAAAVTAALTRAQDTLLASLPATEGGAARGDVRAAMLGLAGFHFAGGFPGPGASDTLVGEGTALAGQVTARLAACAALEAEQAVGWESLDVDAQATALTARLHLLVGHTFPVAPHFVPTNADALDATFARRRLRSREAATGWLAAAGRVQPGARRLRVAMDLLEAVRDDVVFRFSVGQLPDHAGEPWVALNRPTADAYGRLSLLTTSRAPAFVGGPSAGIVLDSWNEAITRPRSTAALAVHFDAPSSRAPQAVLVCTAPDEEGFDFERVRDMVAQTLDLARLRMVGSETLTGLGQFLPAIYLDAALTPGRSS